MSSVPRTQCPRNTPDGVQMSPLGRKSAALTIILGFVSLFLRSPKASTTTAGIQVAPEVGPNMAGVALEGVW